jgi:putative acetyltransferase
VSSWANEAVSDDEFPLRNGCTDCSDTLVVVLFHQLPESWSYTVSGLIDTRKTQLRIVQAVSKVEIEHARFLFTEYNESLDFDLNFQGFDNELATLPGEYAPPDGRLLLANVGEAVSGCVGLRKLEAGICEMKRLYVRSEFRGMGVGKALAETVIKEACEIGYESMRLDTVPSMENARFLYESLGFKKIPPYRYNPIEGAVYMELPLVR